MLAESIATGKVPELILPFRLSRFAENQLVGEKGSNLSGTLDNICSLRHKSVQTQCHLAVSPDAKALSV